MPQNNDITITLKAEDKASDILNKLQKEIAEVGAAGKKPRQN